LKGAKGGGILENEMSLVEIFGILRAKWWLIVVLAVVAGVLAFALSAFVIDPTYTSNGMLLVNNSKSNEGNLNINDINASQKLVNTYSVILKSDTYLKNVIVITGLDYTVSELKGMVSMSSVNNTEVMQVKVNNKNPEHARLLAQCILNHANDAISNVVKGGSVAIIDNASLPVTPSSPNIPLNTVIGILLGIVLAVMIAFVLEMLDTRVRSEEELLAKYSLPVLGVIPNLNMN